MLLRTASLVAATILLMGGASAQSSMTEIGDDVAVPALNTTADKLEGMKVFSSDGIEAGEVEEVAGSDNKTATHLVIDFTDDDSSNYPEKDNVVVPLSDLSMNGDRLIVNLSPQQVDALPTNDD